MNYIFCLLFSIAAFSQTKPLALKIDSIKTSEDVDNNREFIISYHISNLSTKAVSFVLNTKSVIPMGAGSLRPNPYYKLYEKDKSFDAMGIFFSKNVELSFSSEEAFKKYQDSIATALKNKTAEQLFIEKKSRIASNIKKLEPNETLSLQVKLYWNKERYFRNDELEYYIEEKEPYYFELAINLMKEELLLDFSEAERNEFLKDKDLTKGWYTSNKVPIDFSE